MIKGVGVGCLECYPTLTTLFQKLASSSNYLLFYLITSNILQLARDFCLPPFWSAHPRALKDALKFSEFGWCCCDSANSLQHQLQGIGKSAATAS